MYCTTSFKGGCGGVTPERADERENSRIRLRQGSGRWCTLLVWTRWKKYNGVQRSSTHTQTRQTPQQTSGDASSTVLLWGWEGASRRVNKFCIFPRQQLGLGGRAISTTGAGSDGACDESESMSPNFCEGA